MRLGVYIRAITMSYGGSRAVAKKAKDNGLTFVPIMTIWQEANKTKLINTRQLQDYAEALTEVGVEPWIWGYPWVGKEDEFVDRIVWADDVCNGLLRGIIIDPELGYQFKSSCEVHARDGATKLVHETIDAMDEGMDAGTTSYGAYHLQGRFPREEFCLGFGSPQFYTATGGQIDAGMECWKKYFDEIVPSIPAYGKNSEHHLPTYLDKIGPCDGYIFWSWPQMSEIEWNLCRELSERATKKTTPETA